MKKVKLTKGYVALVDDEDYQRIVNAGPWRALVKPRTVYAVRYLRLAPWTYTTQKLHRFILGVTNPKIQVDHNPDPSGLNCQRHNLRKASNRQNGRSAGLSKANTSGFKGVSWSKVGKKWQAHIMLRGKSTGLGLYTTAKKAAQAYDESARKHFGKFAKTNAMLGAL